MATTRTPGSAARTGGEGRPPARIARFDATERLLHWVHALAFFVLLASGLVLYLPSLADLFGNRPLAKDIHLITAVAWFVALLAIGLLGNRRALGRDRREIERFDADDLAWLRGRPAPQGRFNAGQKVHAILQAALAVLFVVSGVLLWLGERNTSFRLDGTIVLHDGAMFIAVALVIGHLFLAIVWPTTRPALRGMVRGDVDEEWAREHHAKWTL